MNSEDIKKFKAAAKRLNDDVNRTPHRAHAHLISMGICNTDKTLTQNYGGEYTESREIRQAFIDSEGFKLDEYE